MSRRPIDKSALRALHAEGCADVVIAARLGCSITGAQKARQRLGLETAGHRGRRRTWDYDTATRLTKSGLTVSEIAKRLGISTGAIHSAATRDAALQAALDAALAARHAERLRRLEADRVRHAQAVEDRRTARAAARGAPVVSALAPPRRLAAPVQGPRDGSASGAACVPEGAVSVPEIWTPDRDALLRDCDGRHAAIAGLAEAWGLPSARVRARWHAVRGRMSNA